MAPTEGGYGDGTGRGTKIVTDLNAGSGGCCSELTGVGNTLFFEGNSGNFNFEIWKSDGTEAGTVMVKDIRPGNRSSGGWSSRYVTAIGDTLYFIADDGEHGVELWKSDGTEAGTVMVKDIHPSQGADGVYEEPSHLTNVNGTLFFSHVTPDGRDRALWKSDGTEAGTVTVKTMKEPQTFWNPVALTPVDGALYFFAEVGFEPFEYELWKSDGTTPGTEKVVDTRFTALGNQESLAGDLFFSAAGRRPHITKLWKTDGTEAGTQVIRAAGMARHSVPGDMQTFDGNLFFVARDSRHHRELFKTDGTEAGTSRVKNINRGTSFDIADLTPVGNRLFFSAGSRSRDLWKTNGTNAGTDRVKKGFTDWFESVAFKGRLFFTARGRGQKFQQLWKSNGTSRGTKPVRARSV